MYEDKIIFVTGGTGSWGYELTKQLLAKQPREIRILSRGELAQVNMNRYFNDQRLKFIIGDVRDYEVLEEALQGVDYVFHLAALKHVPICEIQPSEAIKTNILGTQNLIKACIKNKVKKVIDVSTDKAVDALNLYGMTKAVGERLIIQANLQTSETKFVCIRGGNVLGSNGSVVPFFINRIKNNQFLPITDKKMTRYFITLPQAIELLFRASEVSFGGEIFVMRMPAYYIADIAEVLIEDSDNKEISIKETGMRPGEKLNEVLVSEYEASHTFMYNENYYIIMPTLEIPDLNAYYDKLKLKKATFEKYTSADNVLGKEEVKALLSKANYLKTE